MSSLNKCQLIGRLGDNPEIRYTPSGTCVANLSIATSEQWTDKNTGQKQERTDWHRVVFFGKVAEIAGEYCKKGSQIYIEGQIRTEKYQDKKSGEDRYTTKIYGRDLKLLGSRTDSSQPQAAQQTNAAQPVQSASPVENASAGRGDGFDDDIPF